MEITSINTVSTELNHGNPMKAKMMKKDCVVTAVEEEDIVDGAGAAEDDKIRKRTAAAGGSTKKGSGGGGGSGGASLMKSCQAEKCSSDLSDAKTYHRRHKVCEHHAKAQVVVVAGIRQRFCQQCSRFHELSEFDEAKRSCRRRLAGHNERRRKNPSDHSFEEQGGSASSRIKSGSSSAGSSQLKDMVCGGQMIGEGFRSLSKKMQTTNSSMSDNYETTNIN